MELPEDSPGTAPTEAWAIVRTGGKQYRVRIGDRLDVARSSYIAATVSDADGRRFFSFDDILVVRSPGGETIVGAPNVPNARVVVELLPEKRGRKVTAFKKRRRQNSRRRRGQRQTYQPIVVRSVECGMLLPVGGLVSRPATGNAVPGVTSWADWLAPVLASLKGEAADVALAELCGEDTLSTWAEAPKWVRDELGRAIEALLTEDDPQRRWSAAIALSAITGGPTGMAATSEAVAAALERHFQRTGRTHFLEVEIRKVGGPAAATGSLGQYQARVRLKDVLDMPVGNASSRLMRGTPAGAVLQTQVTGPGVDPDAVRIIMRRERPAGTSREWVADFANDPKAGDYAVLDVVLNGQRVERRFLLLESLAVSRQPPVLQKTNSGSFQDGGVAKSSTPNSPAQGSASSL